MNEGCAMRQLLYIFNSLAMLCDMLCNVLASVAGYYILYTFYVPWNKVEPLPDADGILRSVFREPNVAFLVLVLSAFSILVYYLGNMYTPMRRERSAQHLLRVTLCNATIFIILLLIILAFSNFKLFFFVWLSFTVVLSSLLLMLRWRLFIILRDYLKRTDIGRLRVVIVTDDPALTRYYLREIRHRREYGYDFVGYVGDCRVGRETCLGGLSELDRVLVENKPDEVVFAVSKLSRKNLISLVNIADDRCAKTSLIPHYYSYFRSPRQIVNVGSMPLIDLRYTAANSVGGRLSKRIFDFVVATFMLVALSPVFLVTAIGVKLSSPGPVFFKQERIGKNGKTFTMYKFRSMRENDRGDVEWGSESDPRKTKFGNFIRRYAIDELPQLFNVIIGNMSLVGPRPERAYFVELFRESVPMYMLKHQVLPGITGLSQISGLRGDTSIEERIRKDLEYIENWSFVTDLKILLLTPFRIRNRDEVYAKNEARVREENARLAEEMLEDEAE